MSRSFDEIHTERSKGKDFEIYEPPIHTYSGCRFGYRKKVDATTYNEVMYAKKKRDEEERLRLNEPIIFKKDKKDEAHS